MGPPLEPCNITWRQAEGKPQTTAPLEQLPRGVRFPDDFPEPIQYDSAKKLLIYRGFMDTNSYRYLQKLSKDLDYIRAIDNLNTASAAVAAPSAVVAKPSRLGWWIAAAAGVIGVLAWMIVRFR